MADLSLTDTDAAEIKAILLQWRAEGVENPLLPADVDLNNNGIADAYGLDEDDNVIAVFDVNLKDTVYVSDGEDIVEEVDN